VEEVVEPGELAEETVPEVGVVVQAEAEVHHHHRNVSL
jgi:hypothetical protein